MTQIIVDIFRFIKTCKCKVMLIINKLNLLQELFKKISEGRISKNLSDRKKEIISFNYYKFIIYNAWYVYSISHI
jgi:predicted transcriptional regulator